MKKPAFQNTNSFFQSQSEKKSVVPEFEFQDARLSATRTHKRQNPILRADRVSCKSCVQNKQVQYLQTSIVLGIGILFPLIANGFSTNG